MIETSIYDEAEDRFIVKTTYDAEPVIQQNKAERLAKVGYKPDGTGLVKVGSLHEGDVVRLINLGYNVLSPDPDEQRRAFLYIQQNEPHLLTVDGKPFAKSRPKWR